MATLRSTQLKSIGIYESLAVVVVDGYKPTEERNADNWSLDLPGSAEWLVESYGVQYNEFDPGSKGILWTDYDLGMYDDEWRFSALIDGREVEEFTAFAEEAGYAVDRVVQIDEPGYYGDGGSGVVAILKHPDGWVIL